jgi:ATP-dependent DNA ligase
MVGRPMPSREAAFIKPMECLAVPKFPDGPEWVYEIKLDGYQALAINSDGKLGLYSRKRKSFHRQYSTYTSSRRSESRQRTQL